jgi:hypothetical protein
MVKLNDNDIIMLSDDDTDQDFWYSIIFTFIR